MAIMASEGNQEVKKKMAITLKSKDDKEFVVERKVAEQSQVLKILIENEDGHTNSPIHVEVTSDVFESVLMYCEKHSEELASGIERESTEHGETLIQWDSKYMEEVKKNRELLYYLINAANYLEIKGLLDLTTEAVANMIRGKSPEEIRIILGITNDLTPQEEHEIRQENPWAFEEKGEIHQQYPWGSWSWN